MDDFEAGLLGVEVLNKVSEAHLFILVLSLVDQISAEAIFPDLLNDLRLIVGFTLLYSLRQIDLRLEISV